MAQGRSWLQVAGEIVGALGLVALLGSGISYVVSASATAAAARDGVTDVKADIRAIREDVGDIRDDVSHIRGVIEASKQKKPKG